MPDAGEVAADLGFRLPGLLIVKHEPPDGQIVLAGLGERCRELFRLKLEGYTFQEIQKQMGVKALNTLYTWDFRCRKQLIETLGGDWEMKK